MNATTLKKLIEDNNLRDEFQKFIDYHMLNSTLKVDTHTLKIIVEERENEIYNVIFKVADEYFRVIGSYDSWDGTHFYNLDVEQVKPVQQTITVYQNV